MEPGKEPNRPIQEGTLTLADMMASITKPELVAMARAKGLMTKQSLRKAEFIAQLSREMLEPDMLRRYLLWMPEDELYHLLQCLGIDAGQRLRMLLENEKPVCVPDSWLGDAGYACICDVDSLEDWAVELPRDVTARLREILNPAFLAEYEQYLWLQNVLSLGTELYQMIPLDVFQQLLLQWPGWKLSEPELLAAIQKQPLDLDRYVLGKEYIVSTEIKQENYVLWQRKGTESYYLPSERDIWFHNIYTGKAQLVMQSLTRKMMNTWGNLEEIGIANFLELVASGITADMPEQQMKELLYDIYDEVGMADDLWPDIRSYARKMGPYIRKARNHGFSDEEMKQRERTARREQKNAQKAAGGPNNVVSLDEQRRKRKHKKHKRK